MTIVQRQQVYSTPTKKPSSGVIYENIDITKKVEEEYQRKKKEEITFASNQVNMKKKKYGQ